MILQDFTLIKASCHRSYGPLGTAGPTGSFVPMVFLLVFIAGLGCGYLAREVISRRRRSRERSRRYLSEMDETPPSTERRLQPLTETEMPPSAR